MEMGAPLPDFLSGLPTKVLLMINDRIPCLVQRRRLAQACPAIRNAIRSQQQQPASRQLPWILLPRADGPSFSCVLRGCDTNSHDVDVPADARAVRYFGTYEGGCVSAAPKAQTDGHTLLNIRTHQRFGIPDVVNLGGALNFDIRTAIVAATLSSPPEHEHCVVAAICCFAPRQLVRGPCVRAFWHLGHPVPMNNDEAATAAFTGPNLEDVIHHDGAFHFLTDEEDLPVFEPLVHDDGRLEMISIGTRRFGHHRHYDGDAHIRYLVESREQLLMVVRLTPHLRQPMAAFRVFQMMQAHVSDSDGDDGGYNIAEYTWNETAPDPTKWPTTLG
ncbi:hypothetical protein E2562_029261 [Oryza meyeriana var. granulata]|uniref:KIB1-4 beta-propeller domain-containing protein n=1 Tax=Oryza meyeriana var. granulata TaxID=110450 RepID=A0A6G1EQX4_9ORYZ|nr:hypothetical protein E2562_029261 [Oryza meyeriana var. granulata]